MREKALTFFSLFTSASTLVCCALPALFVSLGMGAVFAGLITRFPQLIWLSEHKTTVFTIAALFLALAGLAQWKARNIPCPTDPKLAAACTSSRRWGNVLYGISVVVYFVGLSFAFGPTLIRF